MAIEDIARYLGNGLGETLAVRPSDAPYVRYGTVAAVNADGTLDVTIDGTTLRGVCATTGCVGAAEGMRCVVLRQGPLATVVGLVANTNLADIYLQNAHTIRGYDTDGNAREVLQVTNGYNNVALGWGGYDASQGHTNVYGNEINLTSRGKINLNGDVTDGLKWASLNTANASGGGAKYITFGDVAIVSVDLSGIKSANPSNDAIFFSGLPRAKGEQAVFLMRAAQSINNAFRCKVQTDGTLRPHYTVALDISSGKQYWGLVAYPYTR